MIMQSAFIVAGPSLKKGSLNHVSCPRNTRSYTNNTRPNVTMKVSVGKPALFTGITILTAILTNRIVFTPLDSLAMTQSRSDILGVITGATLVLYGVGKAEIADAKKAVEIGGENVRKGFSLSENELTKEVEWAANAIFKGIPNVKSFALVSNGVGQFFLGRFRNQDVDMKVVDGGIIANAMASGQRAYLADMKVVPVKETEFGFLPKGCQAVIVQPVSEKMAIVLGANKPRPLTGSDFGWIQALANRLADVYG